MWRFNLDKIIKNYWQVFLLIVVGIVFFGVYSWLPLQLASLNIGQFNSPDEEGNFFWTKRLSSSQPLYLVEGLERAGNNLIRLRGMNVSQGKIMPGSFLGLNLIYGSLGKILGSAILPFLTPLAAVVGVIFFYFLIAQIFSKRLALISALLAFFSPSWLYFANRGFYHNILFVSLLTIGLYFFVRVCLRPVHLKLSKYLLYGAAGLFIGFALLTRTSEIGWAALTVALIFVFNFKRIFWPGFLVFLSVLVFVFTILFYHNLILYQAPLSIGYQTEVRGEFLSLLTQASLILRLLLSPFGIHFKSIVFNGYNYLINIFWWFFVPFLFGFISWLFTSQSDPSSLTNSEKIGKPNNYLIERVNRKKRQWAYSLIVFIITFYLLLFYGSWQISDRIDQNPVSIGTSYVRYFLIIYLGLLPWLAWLIDQIGRLFIKGLKSFRLSVYSSLVLIFLLLLSLPSFDIVFWRDDESLLMIRQNLFIQQKKAELVSQYIPPQSVVVSGFKQADKIIFPERRVIPELAVTRDYQSLSVISRLVPLYYYHFAPTTTVSFISRKDFEPFGLRIQEIGQRIIFNERIYRIVEFDLKAKAGNRKQSNIDY